MHREPGLVGIDPSAVKARSGDGAGTSGISGGSSARTPWSVVLQALRRPKARGPMLAIVVVTLGTAAPLTLAAMLAALPAVDVLCDRAASAVQDRTWMELVIVMHGVLLPAALVVTTRIVRTACAAWLLRVCEVLEVGVPPRVASPLLPSLLGLLAALPVSLLPVLRVPWVGNALWPVVVAIVTAHALGALAGARRARTVDAMLLAVALVPGANLCVVPLAVVMGARPAATTLRAADKTGNLET